MRKKTNFRGPVFYKFLYAYVSVFHRLFYRKVTVIGFEKIPANTPVIFAPNHQNALMDALAVLFAARRPVVFMARADIFKKPLIAKILNVLKILPIYRIRDGYAELGRNQEVFDATVDVLNSNTPICILPEGNHEGRKRLRPLKKGIFRMAFQAEQSRQFKLNLQIVPVGIDYSDYYHAGADLVVVIGSPIPVAQYAAQYVENEQKTINTLVGVLAENISNLMIDIPDENYELIYQLSEMYEPVVWDTHNEKRHPYNRLTIRQYIVQKFAALFTRNPLKADELRQAIAHYSTKVNAAGFSDKLLRHNAPKFLWLLIDSGVSILLLPLYVYGLLLNYIPYKLPLYQASKAKDPNFRTSIQFAISLLIFPVYYIIPIALFCYFSAYALWEIIFAISLPVSGLFAFYHHKHIKWLWGRVRIFWFKQMHRSRYNELMLFRKQVIEQIKTNLNN